MRYEHVFGDVRPFSQCHASTILRRADGGLYLAWFGGSRESHRDTAIWAADRLQGNSTISAGSNVDSASGPNGTHPSWSEPRVIAKVKDEAHWNPVLFALSDEEFVLHFKVGMQIRRWTTWVQRSSDAGVSWGRGEPLVPGERGGRGAVKNKPIRLRSGEWLAGASIEGWRRWDAFVDRSENGIGGWKASPLFDLDREPMTGKGIIQPTLWQSDNLCVHALFRSTEGVLYRSDSNDEGVHWSRARPTLLPNNNSGVDVVQMRNGILALACNPVEGNWAERSPLSILFSRDNGESWPERIDVETGPGEFSYPALIEDGDGLCIAFTWNRRRIAVAQFSGDELPSI